MDIKLTKHQDAVFALPTLWGSVENNVVIISLSFLIFSLDFEIKNKDNEFLGW